MEEHSDRIYVGMDCDDREQFLFVLKNIWMELNDSNKLASFNYIGRMRNSILPKKPPEFRPNPLSELGIAVMSNDPLTDNLLKLGSDYRDPCFFENGEMVLASSSDHISIFGSISQNLISELHIDHIIQKQPGSIADL